MFVGCFSVLCLLGHGWLMHTSHLFVFTYAAKTFPVVFQASYLFSQSGLSSDDSSGSFGVSVIAG